MGQSGAHRPQCGSGCTCQRPTPIHDFMPGAQMAAPGPRSPSRSSSSTCVHMHAPYGQSQCLRILSHAHVDNICTVRPIWSIAVLGNHVGNINISWIYRYISRGVLACDVWSTAVLRSHAQTAAIHIRKVNAHALRMGKPSAGQSSQPRARRHAMYPPDRRFTVIYYACVSYTEPQCNLPCNPPRNVSVILRNVSLILRLHPRCTWGAENSSTPAPPPPPRT